MCPNSQIHFEVSVWLMTNFVSLVANILLNEKRQAGRIYDLGIWPRTITFIQWEPPLPLCILAPAKGHQGEAIPQR